MSTLTKPVSSCPKCGSSALTDGACDDCGTVLPGISLIAGAATPPPAPAAAPSYRVTRATTRSSIRVTVSTGAKASARVQATRGSTSRRNALGGGLVSLPPMPSNKPLDMLMADPVVPPSKRVCQGQVQDPRHPGDPKKKVTCYEPDTADPANLDHPTLLKREKGFCPRCGTSYNFTPGLKKDDVVCGQYRIHGPIAYGGLGWIYLGFDDILQRWVVLKGLLNSQDEAAAATALAERQFLAAVKHPKIVGVYNFVRHGTEGYIVMEYVGGRTLRSLRKERGPFPPAEAVSYVLGILPAFAYLHDQGLVYCDMKPDNFMIEEADVKLIDMGAVRKIDDPDGMVFATQGYEAPEMSETPTSLSDLYTIGRTLANLIMDFSMVNQHPFDLPPSDEQPVLATYESLRLFLDRACAKDPELRFQSADEMAEQLFGVLREIVAIDSSEAKPGISACFLGEGLLEEKSVAMVDSTDLSMPRLRPDPEDKALPELMNAAALKGKVLIDQIAAIRTRHPKSREAAVAQAQALIANGRAELAEKVCQDMLEKDPYAWKAWFLMGRALFAEGRYREAGEQFARVRAELPGEPAAQLALALALEKLGETAAAATLNERVSLIDPSFVSACFGLARCYLSQNNRDGAVEALARVPSGNALRGAAQAFTVSILATARGKDRPEARHLDKAAETLQDLPQDSQATQLLAAALLIEAASQLESKTMVGRLAGPLLGRAASPRDLRLGAEHALREAARLASTPAARLSLVDQANAARPATWF